MSIEAIIAGIIAVGVFLLGVVVNGYRARINELQADNKELRAELRAIVAEVRDIREKYVRRDDLNGHLIAIGLSIAEVKDGMKDLTKLVLAALANSERK